MTSILVLLFVLGTIIYSIVSTNRKLSDPNFDSKEFYPLVGGFIVVAAFAFDIVLFATLNMANAGWFIAIAGIISLFAIGFLVYKVRVKK